VIQVYNGRDTKKALREGLRFAQQSSDALESSAFAVFGQISTPIRQTLFYQRFLYIIRQ